MIIQPYEHEHLKMIPFVLGFISNNSYALYDDRTNDCIVIDPSLHFDEVLLKLDEKGLRPRDFWLTHGHFDHYIGTGEKAVLERGIPAHMHPLDQPLYESGGVSLRAPLPQMKFCPQPVTDLEDGKILKVGAYEFQVLHTPGHAPGHCCFYCAEAGWLFSGDLIFYHTYGRTDIFQSCEADLFRSLREKVLTLPEDTLIFPGHEEFTRVGEEKMMYA